MRAGQMIFKAGLLLASATVLPAAAPVPAAPQTGTLSFRDLNHNGRMDRYEDPGAPVEQRIDDLLAQMTLEEKAGMMVHGTLAAVDSPLGASRKGYDLGAARTAIMQRHANSFITRLTMPAAEFAAQNNAVQKIAEASRLGIPVTISTDPRHHFESTLGASTNGGGISQWPNTLAFAALGDPALVRRFGDIARQEYRAMGITMALSPQADVGVEPRWARYAATFGSDPATISRLAGAYVVGFQGSPTGLTRDGVATVVKHWVGYGAEPGGFDGHNYYGQQVTLTDTQFKAHVRAFDGALAAHSAGVMPTYVIVTGPKVDGRPLEPVGAGFSKQLLADLLRREKGFGGVIVSDWGITNDCPRECRAPDAAHPQMPWHIAMPWGVEDLTPTQRFAKGINAGIDQFGGVDDAAPVIAAVQAGLLTEARIDASVRRLLRVKFEMGLFDNPYVDAEVAGRIVGQPAWRQAGESAQRAAQVLLADRGHVLPVKPGRRVWLSGVDAAAARSAGYVVVDDPAKAEVALVRGATPFEVLHPHHFFGSRQHEGRIAFTAEDAPVRALTRARAAGIPAIFAVEMDRPADLTVVRPVASAILVNFGTSDAALLDVVAGRARAKGHMPFPLPGGAATR